MAHLGVRRVVEAVLGGPSVTIPIAQYQFKTPSATSSGVPITPHQDHFYNPGLRFRTFWVPLEPIGEALGGLTVAPGWHQRGWLHDKSSPGGEWRPDAIPDDEWATAD